MTAESMLWLLMTGQVPTPEQSRDLSRELAEKGELPTTIPHLIDSQVSDFLPHLSLMLTPMSAYHPPSTP